MISNTKWMEFFDSEKTLTKLFPVDLITPEMSKIHFETNHTLEFIPIEHIDENMVQIYYSKHKKIKHIPNNFLNQHIINDFIDNDLNYYDIPDYLMTDKICERYYFRYARFSLYNYIRCPHYPYLHNNFDCIKFFKFWSTDKIAKNWQKCHFKFQRCIPFKNYNEYILNLFFNHSFKNENNLNLTHIHSALISVNKELLTLELLTKQVNKIYSNHLNITVDKQTEFILWFISWCPEIHKPHLYHLYRGDIHKIPICYRNDEFWELLIDNYKSVNNEICKVSKESLKSIKSKKVWFRYFYIYNNNFNPNDYPDEILQCQDFWDYYFSIKLTIDKIPEKFITSKMIKEYCA